MLAGPLKFSINNYKLKPEAEVLDNAIERRITLFFLCALKLIHQDHIVCLTIFLSSVSFAETTPHPTPVFKADIVFLLDSSLGVTKDNFNKEKQFISRLSQALNLSPQNSRVAIVLYALYPRLAIQLGILQTPEALAIVLEGLTRSVGLRRMDRALQRASIAFDKKRPDVRKIVILLTAGPQTGGGQRLIEAVKPLRTIGAETYVVAIGSQVNVPELRSAVNRNDDMMMVRTFDRLLSNVRVIAEYIINGMFAFQNNIQHSTI